MTDILSSNGDLSSTPSNRSEYFSVTSSLSVLASTEEVYHSFDEDINNNVIVNSHRVVQRNEILKITKQKHMEIDIDENGYKLSTSNETIPESMTCRNSLECEFYDKYLQRLRVVKSQNSLNSFEDDCNNSSMFSNSYIKDRSSITEDYNNNEISDNEHSNSISINITTQLNTSQIDGELSDINEIVYESNISPVNNNNELTSDENQSSQIENEITDELSEIEIPDDIDQNKIQTTTENELQPIKIVDEISEDILPIYEMVKQLECSQLQSSMIVDGKSENTTENNILIINESEDNLSLNQKTLPDVNQRPLIENVEDSPIKRTYLCCSIRKNKKNKIENKKSKKFHNLKTIHLFSFFNKKSTKTEKISINNKEVISEKSSPCNHPVLIKLNSIDYDAIPYIDADVAIDTEAYISLAKQEFFSE